MTQFEKEAKRGLLMALRGLADDAVKAVRPAFSSAVTKAQPIAAAAGKQVADTARVVGSKAKQLGSAALDVSPRQMGGAIADRVGRVGQFTMDTGRRALNVADDTARHAFSGPNRQAPAGRRLGDLTVGRVQGAAKRFGSSAMTNVRNPLNLAVGTGTITGVGAYGLGPLFGGGEAAAPAAAAASPAQQFGQQAGQQAGGSGGGLLGSIGQAWSNLPTEAKWAIGLGLPIAALGGLRGGAGGMGLGALGLGAAALGGASGGLFGDDARRMVGRGMNSLAGVFGAQNESDPMSQIAMLKRLSPGLGATALMGRNAELSPDQAAEQYNFLTQNEDQLRELMPLMQQKGASALFKVARCWEGYEPVPGKEPYSEGSCRPKGSKKKKKEEKSAASSVFKLTEKKPEAVVNGDKPSTEASKEVAVTRSEPKEDEDLRPEEVLPTKA